MFDPPHQAYLVQWLDGDRTFIATWEWRATIDSRSMADASAWMDDWKDNHPLVSYRQYQSRYPLAFTASASGNCFFGAVRVDCHVLQDLNLVPATLISALSFMNKDGEEREDTNKKAILRFVAFARRNGAQLSTGSFCVNQVRQSVNSVEQLAALPLDEGVYVIGVECALGIRHCFALQPTPAGARLVHDDSE